MRKKAKPLAKTPTIKIKTPKEMLAGFLKSLTTRERGLYKKSPEYLLYKRSVGTTTAPYLPAKIKKQREKRKLGGTNAG